MGIVEALGGERGANVFAGIFIGCVICSTIALMIIACKI